MHVASSHGHPFSRAHRSISRCPPFAAYAHVPSFHGHPSRRAHRSTSGGLPRRVRATSPRSTGTRSDAPTGGPRGGLPAPRTRTRTWAWAPRSCRARASPLRGTPSPRTRTSSGTIRDLSPRRRGSRGASCRGTARGLGGRRRETCRGWSRPCVSRAPRADAASGGPRRVVPRDRARSHLTRSEVVSTATTVRIDRAFSKPARVGTPIGDAETPTDSNVGTRG